jgi:hypothetical protein
VFPVLSFLLHALPRKKWVSQSGANRKLTAGYERLIGLFTVGLGAHAVSVVMLLGLTWTMWLFLMMPRVGPMRK